MIAWPDSTPIPGALVSVEAIGVAVLSGRDGSFALTGLPAGTHTVQARMIGFRPAHLTIRVLALAELPSTESRGYLFSLPRVPVVLDVVTIRAAAPGPCRVAGFAQATDDPRVAPIMDQLRANAERYRALADKFPVEYTVARTRHFRVETGALFAERTDTVTRRSDVRRAYEPGHVLDRRFTSGRPVIEREMHVPGFAEVAGDEFQRWHCFRYAGMERVEGELLHRIDFLPTRDIDMTDVEGMLYIDARSFLLRRSVFRLTRLPPRMRVRSVETITTYREIEPAVLVPDALTTFESVYGIKVGGAKVQGFLQRDQLLSHRAVGQPGKTRVVGADSGYVAR